MFSLHHPPRAQNILTDFSYPPYSILGISLHFSFFKFLMSDEVLPSCHKQSEPDTILSVLTAFSVNPGPCSRQDDIPTSVYCLKPLVTTAAII